MSRSSSRARARFPARLSRVAGGVIGLRTRDVIIAIVAHSRHHHRSKSFVLSAYKISFRSSSRAACDTLRSLSLSRSLGQERDHLYQKGIRPRRRRSLSKVSKRLSREKSKRYRPISNRVFARLRHKSAVFSLLRKATILDRIPDSESNRTRFCFRRSRTQNGSKNNETPFLRFNKANKNLLSNNNNITSSSYQ